MIYKMEVEITNVNENMWSYSIRSGDILLSAGATYRLQGIYETITECTETMRSWGKERHE